MKDLIRVLVVDDHQVVRKGLATFLYVFPDLELAGEAESGERAVELCALLRPDVVLMDLVLSDHASTGQPDASSPGRAALKMDGIAAIREIRARFPQVQMIALTSFKDRQRVQDAIQAGAIGYLLKDVSAEDLANAIRAAHSGSVTLAPEATQALIETVRLPEQPQPELTDREAEILSCLVAGLSNQEIAGRLCFSLSTIKQDLRRIFEKLGVSNRTEAVAEATRRGWVLRP